MSDWEGVSLPNSCSMAESGGKVVVGWDKSSGCSRRGYSCRKHSFMPALLLFSPWQQHTAGLLIWRYSKGRSIELLLPLRRCFVLTQEIAEAVSLAGRVRSNLAVITDDVRCQENQQIDLVTIAPVGTEEVSQHRHILKIRHAVSLPKRLCVEITACPNFCLILSSMS